MAKFVFVTGGVVSALGKGIAGASLGEAEDHFSSAPRHHLSLMGLSWGFTPNFRVFGRTNFHVYVQVPGRHMPCRWHRHIVIAIITGGRPCID